MARKGLVRMTPEVLASLCFESAPGHWYRCVKGLPEGARHVATHYDWHSDSVLLTFEHESFADVPLGGQLPFLAEPQFESKYDEGSPEHDWNSQLPNGVLPAKSDEWTVKEWTDFVSKPPTASVDIDTPVTVESRSGIAPPAPIPPRFKRFGG